MKHFTKKLALLTLLAGMCGSAWADNVYNIVYGVPTYGSDGITITGVNPQTDFTSDDGTTASDITHNDANGANCTNAMPIGGSVLSSSSSFTKYFENAATNGIVHFEANYTATTNGQETWKIVDSNNIEIFGTTDSGWSNGNADRSWGFCNGVSLGTNWFRQARGGHNRVVLDINLSTKVVSYTVLVSSGNNSYSTLTGTYNLPNNVSDVKGLSVTKGNYASYMDNVSLYNVYDNNVTEFDYTINYQLDGETLKTTNGKAEADAIVTAESPLIINDIKYFAAEGATTSFTVSSTESNNVFNVALRVANNYTYSINAVDNNQNLLKVLSSGTVVEGETVNYGYSQYISNNGVLYTSPKQNSNPWWGKSFTPQADGETVTITYSKEGTTGVVFCEEAENISTLTAVTGGNTDIRASNRAGGYAASDALITTLPAGKYKIFGATYGNSGVTFTVKAGEETVFTITTTGNPVHTEGDEFVLTEETEIIVPQAGNGGDSPKSIDYIYIVKTADYVTVPGTLEAGKYATRIFPFTPTVPEGIIFYSCGTIEDGRNLALREVEAPRENTPYILYNNKENAIDITQSGVDIHAADEYESEWLIGVFADKEITSGYVLQTQNGKQAFYKVDAENPITVPPYRAYLNYTAGVKSIGFDTTTAINTLEVLTSGAYEGIYTVDGVKLNRLEKGVNILKMADGTTRKVVVK